MPETTATATAPETPVVTTATTPPAPTEPTEQSESAELGDSGKKALDAERKARTAAEKESKALKARLDEIEAASLTELQKAQKLAADSEARLAEYEKTTIRQRVALTKGVPADLVDRLRGDTEAEISADADALLALVKAPTTPKPDLTQGGTGASGQGGTPADDFARFLKQSLGA